MKKEGKDASLKETDQELYARNQCKYEESKFKFESITVDIKELLEKTESKVDRVVIDLTMKFSKEI